MLSTLSIAVQKCNPDILTIDKLFQAEDDSASLVRCFVLAWLSPNALLFCAFDFA